MGLVEMFENLNVLCIDPSLSCTGLFSYNAKKHEHCFTSIKQKKETKKEEQLSTIYFTIMCGVENKNIASQLVFSATAYAVAKDVDKFKFFADEIHQCGAKIIIKRFETKFIPLNNIKDFNLDYIRLARDYTNEISNDYSKQSFVESISELTTLLNIKLLAENVQKDEDLAFIKKHNLYAASR